MNSTDTQTEAVEATRAIADRAEAYYNECLANPFFTTEALATVKEHAEATRRAAAAAWLAAMETSTEIPDTVTIEGAWSDAYNIAEGKDRPEGADPCVVCGKTIHARKGFWVHLINGGADAVRLDTEVTFDPRGDMGWWAIGSDCARKVPDTHRASRGEVGL